MRAEDLDQAALAAWNDGRRDDAERLWQESAAAGSASAMFNLGLTAHQNGHIGEAQAWFEQAGALGHESAAFNAGYLAETDRADRDRAWVWYLKAWELGSAAAGFNLAVLARAAGDRHLESEWTHRAADAGDATAAYQLWRWASAADPEGAETLRLLELAADRGSSEAMGIWADHLLRSDAPEEALEWVHRAIAKETDAGSGETPLVGRLFGILASVLVYEQRLEEAREATLRAIALGAGDPAGMLSTLDNMIAEASESEQASAFDLTQTEDFPLLLGALGSLIAELDDTIDDWEDEYEDFHSIWVGALVELLPYLPGATSAEIGSYRRGTWGVTFDDRSALPSLGELDARDRQRLVDLIIDAIGSLHGTAATSDRGALAMILTVIADDPWASRDQAAQTATEWAEVQRDWPGDS